MLNSLEIKNYRNLKDLRIEKLGRLNLIVGKNNTGKSSLLEAISILGSYSPIYAIQRILEQRLENLIEENDNIILNEQITSVIRNIFYNKEYEKSIFIGDTVSNIEFSYNPLNKDYSFIPTLSFQKMKSEKIVAGFGKGFDLMFETRENPPTKKQIKETRYISSSLFQTELDSISDWKNISLHPEKEDFVIKGLSILKKGIQQFNYVAIKDVNDNKFGYTKQQPRVRLSTGEIVNLRSMGDGINRILTIILAMVNCENGYLLIDEFENGLHYSVQEKLWEIIFFLADKLNVQVFATTHSNDTIRTFEEVANLKPEYHDAQLIKLRLIDGEVDAVATAAEDLKVIVEGFIDPR